MNKEMTVEDTDDTESVFSVDLTDMLLASRDCLNSSRFDDAETGFLKLFKEIQVNISIFDEMAKQVFKIQVIKTLCD